VRESVCVCVKEIKRQEGEEKEKRDVVRETETHTDRDSGKRPLLTAVNVFNMSACRSGLSLPVSMKRFAIPSKSALVMAPSLSKSILWK